jgi:hypothetical protein
MQKVPHGSEPKVNGDMTVLRPERIPEAQILHILLLKTWFVLKLQEE